MDHTAARRNRPQLRNQLLRQRRNLSVNGVLRAPGLFLLQNFFAGLNVRPFLLLKPSASNLYPEAALQRREGPRRPHQRGRSVLE